MSGVEGHAGQSDESWEQLVVSVMKWSYDVTLSTRSSRTC